MSDLVPYPQQGFVLEICSLFLKYVGLVVTGIKCVSTCRRFLNQSLLVRLLELGFKSKEAIPKNSSQ